MANLPSVNNDTFKTEVLESETPVLVDFSAAWCGPCKLLGPTLEQLSTEYNGNVRIVTLDVDESQATAVQYGVMSVPTMIIFKNGEIAGRMMGNRPKPEIVGLLDQALSD